MDKQSELVSFIAGSLIGAGLALLLTPRTGTENRESLKKMSQDMKERVNLKRFVNDNLEDL